MFEQDIYNWILYQDQSILVINKPAGVLTIQDGYKPDIPHLRSILEPIYGRLYIVHRLDKDTSGVMVIARNEISHRNLNLQFDNRIVKKQYQAIIIGNPAWDKIIVDTPLTVNGDRSHRTRVLPHKGKPAQTEYSKFFCWQAITQVTAKPQTGYTHQVRAHISSIGYPILFDSLYTSPDLKAKAADIHKSLDINSDDQRMMLHASEISLLHPESGESISFEAPMQPDMMHIISVLNKKRSIG
jgi:tRNA pseudouridine32 synthase / 23S rRNA pseudouridine746 synthase